MSKDNKRKPVSVLARIIYSLFVVLVALAAIGGLGTLFYVITKII